MLFHRTSIFALDKTGQIVILAIRGREHSRTHHLDLFGVEVCFGFAECGNIGVRTIENMNYVRPKLLLDQGEILLVFH